MKRRLYSLVLWLLGSQHAHAQGAAGPDFIFNTLYGQGGLMAVIIGLITVIIRHLGKRTDTLEAKCETLATNYTTLLREVLPLTRDAIDVMRSTKDAMVATGAFQKEAHDQNSRKIDDLVKGFTSFAAQVQAALAVKP